MVVTETKRDERQHSPGAERTNYHLAPKEPPEMTAHGLGSCRKQLEATLCGLKAQPRGRS